MPRRREFEKQRIKDLEKLRGIEFATATGTGFSASPFGRKDDPYWLPEGKRIGDLWREATAKQPPLTELSVQVSYLLFSSTYAQCWLDFVQADLEEIQIVSDRIILALKGRSPHRKRPIQMYLSLENKLVERLREILEIVNDDQKLRGCSPTENLEVQARMREFSGILNREISERRRAKS